MIALDHGRPWATGGPNVLHSEWWLRAHWGRAFEVVNVRPFFDDGQLRQGHGWILLREDDRPAPTTTELERLEPDEPREIAALQFNIEFGAERVARFWGANQTGSLRIENDRLRAELETLQSSKTAPDSTAPSPPPGCRTTPRETHLLTGRPYCAGPFSQAGGGGTFADSDEACSGVDFAIYADE